MEVSKYLVSWIKIYLRNLQPTYIGVITDSLSTMDIPGQFSQPGSFTKRSVRGKTCGVRGVFGVYRWLGCRTIEMPYIYTYLCLFTGCKYVLYLYMCHIYLFIYICT